MNDTKKARTTSTILLVVAIINWVLAVIIFVGGFFAAVEASTGVGGSEEAFFAFIGAISIAIGVALFGLLSYGLSVSLSMLATVVETQKTPPPAQIGEQGSEWQ